jgi:hypothetical protein
MGKTIAAVIIATALAVSGWTYAIARPATVHNVTHAFTRVVREPSAVRTVIRWKTRTVIVTKTGGAGSTTPCDEQNGTVVPIAGAAASGATGLTTCTLSIQADVPAANGDQLVITAPDGTSNSYQLGAPAVTP